MTRVNLVPVRELSDQHLLSEHREIVRIPNQVRSGKLSAAGAPESFRLGTGHVKFFADKLGFVRDRYLQVYEECIARGFQVTYMGSAFYGTFTRDQRKQWTPSSDDIAVSRERIQEKLSAKPGFYRFTVRI
jgi:hypothetical protein